MRKSKQQKKEVKDRASKPDHMYSYCRVIGCGKTARAGTSDGLDRMYCRCHSDHHKRHGDPLKKSYPAKVLNPYRQATLVWIIDHPDEFWVKDAVGRMEGLYRCGGQHIEAFRLRGLAPKERAKAHWARLRQHEVDPKLPISAWLAVEMVIADDSQPVLKKEFKRVQAAKLVHRMASGTHKQWEREKPHPLHPGLPPLKEIDRTDWYPKSRGRVLRHIGEDLEGAVELLAEHHLAEIHEFKVERDKYGSYTWSPYPTGIVARARKQ